MEAGSQSAAAEGAAGTVRKTASAAAATPGTRKFCFKSICCGGGGGKLLVLVDHGPNDSSLSSPARHPFGSPGRKLAESQESVVHWCLRVEAVSWFNTYETPRGPLEGARYATWRLATAKKVLKSATTHPEPSSGNDSAAPASRKPPDRPWRPARTFRLPCCLRNSRPDPPWFNVSAAPIARRPPGGRACLSRLPPRYDGRCSAHRSPWPASRTSGVGLRRPRRHVRSDAPRGQHRRRLHRVPHRMGVARRRPYLPMTERLADHGWDSCPMPAHVRRGNAVGGLGMRGCGPFTPRLDRRERPCSSAGRSGPRSSAPARGAAPPSSPRRSPR